MKTLKKVGAFFALLAYVIGAINGVAYSIHIHQVPTALCVAVLAVMAFPTAKRLLAYLLGSDEK